MNEERVLALAGVFQGAALAQQLATDGRCDEAAFEASIASVFRIDADSVASVYGGVAGVRRGLRTLVAQFDDQTRDVAVMRADLSRWAPSRRARRRVRKLRATFARETACRIPGRQRSVSRSP